MFSVRQTKLELSENLTIAPPPPAVLLMQEKRPSSNLKDI